MLGIDPDPAKLWPAAVERTSEARARLATTLSEAELAAGGVRESTSAQSSAGVVARLETAAAVLAHCRALIDAAAPAVRRRQAPARLLRAPRRARLAGAGARRARMRASAACSCSPTASAATSPSPRRPTAQALVSSTPSPFGSVAGLARRRLHRQPAARPRRARAADRRRARPRRPARSCSCAPPTRARPTCSTSKLDTGERLWERHREPRRRPRPSRPRGSRRRRRRHRRDRAPAPRAPARADAEHARSCCPGIGAQGGDVAALAPAFAPGRPAGSSRPRARSPTPTSPAAPAAARGRPRRGRAAARAGMGAELTAPGTKLEGDGRSQPRALSGAHRAGRVRLRALLGRAGRTRPVRRGLRVARAHDRDADRDQGSEKKKTKKRKSYTVKAGDTPSGIAEKTGISLETLHGAQPRSRPADPRTGPEDQADRVRRTGAAVAAWRRSLLGFAAPAQAARAPACPDAVGAPERDRRSRSRPASSPAPARPTSGSRSAPPRS